MCVCARAHLKSQLNQFDRSYQHTAYRVLCQLNSLLLFPLFLSLSLTHTHHPQHTHTRCLHKYRAGISTCMILLPKKHSEKKNPILKEDPLPTSDDKPGHVRWAGQECCLSCKRRCDWRRKLSVTAEKQPSRYRRRCGLFAERLWIFLRNSFSLSLETLIDFTAPDYGLEVFQLDPAESGWVRIKDVWHLHFTRFCASVSCHTCLRVPGVHPPEQPFRLRFFRHKCTIFNWQNSWKQ